MRETLLHPFADPEVSATFPRLSPCTTVAASPGRRLLADAAAPTAAAAIVLPYAGIAGAVAAWRVDPSAAELVVEALSPETDASHSPRRLRPRGVRVPLPAAPIARPVVIPCPPRPGAADAAICAFLPCAGGQLVRYQLDVLAASSQTPGVAIADANQAVAVPRGTIISALAPVPVVVIDAMDDREQEMETDKDDFTQAGGAEPRDGLEAANSSLQFDLFQMAVGLDTGECGIAFFAVGAESANGSSTAAPQYHFEPFSYEDRAPSTPMHQADNLSAVSDSSKPGAPIGDASHSGYTSTTSATNQSAASTTSRSFFINRLFRSSQQHPETPSRQAPAARDVHGDRSHGRVDAYHANITDSSALPRAPMVKTDHVHAMMPATVLLPGQVDASRSRVRKLTVPAFVVFHQSGRVCIFYRRHPSSPFVFAVEGNLPALPGRGMSHFLVPGPGQSAFIVVTVDEDPRPHALHVYAISWSMSDQQKLTMSCELVAMKLGPIDRIVGTSLLPGAGGILIATDCGHLLSLMWAEQGAGQSLHGVRGERLTFEHANHASNPMPGIGIWTLVDDMSGKFCIARSAGSENQNVSIGLWDVFDSVHLDNAERLFAARRFSLSCIAKAVRVPHLADASRADVFEVVSNLTENSLDDSIDRVLLRARNKSLESDLQIQGMWHVPGVGIAIARQIGICVLRPYLQAEIEVLSTRSISVTNLGSTGQIDPTVTRLLGGHAVPQIAAAKYVTAKSDSCERSTAACVLSVALRMSEREPEFSLCELAAIADGPRQSDYGLLLQDVVDELSSKLSPRRQTLQFLYHAREFAGLRYAAEQCSKSLPISCIFALGVVFLESDALLAALEQESRSAGDDADHSELMADREETSPLTNAFASFVAAARLARECRLRETLSNEDIQCIVDLTEVKSSNSLKEIESQLHMSSQSTYHSLIVNHLDFWILERCLRLIEARGSAKTAAACALEAMVVAPSAKLYEMMRAVAFQRFLDMGDLECALQTILREPFTDDKAEDLASVRIDDANAFRDCIGLLVNAAVDSGRFSWLLTWGLPGAVKELAALALERRARSTDAVSHAYLMQEDREMTGLGRASNLLASNDISGPYEYLYVWLLEMDDLAGAGACGLEWYERVSTEGLAQARTAATSFPGKVSGSPITPLVTWGNVKARALAAACLAVRQLPPSMQFVNRSRHSIVAGYSALSGSGAKIGTVDLDWLSRRHLLSRAQVSCLTSRLSISYVDRGLTMPAADYIVGHAQHLLADDEKGVNFVASSLLAPPMSLEKVCLAVDIAIAWIPEHGDERLVHVIHNTAKVAAGEVGAQVKSMGLSSVELSELLEIVNVRTKALPSSGSCRRNWYLVAAEGMLSGSVGHAGIPKWCTDAAMWATKPFGVGVEAWEDGSNESGNPSGMARAFLRYNRPCDAAQVLLHLLRIVQREDSQDYNFHVPLNVIEATLAALEHAEDSDGKGASEWYRRLYKAMLAYKEYARMAMDRESFAYHDSSEL
jgi:hypothetical protein